MPELPEVETMRRDLEREVVGRRIERARVWRREGLSDGRPIDVAPRVRRIWQARTEQNTLEDGLALHLEEHTISSVRRRGKYLLLDLDSAEALMIHLGMTGHLWLSGRDDEPEKHHYLTLALDDGRELRLSDPRGFGEARALTRDEVEALWRRLGPEPLSPEFSAEYLAAQLARRKALIKPLLLNQTIVAGLGNIYVDEALWGARVHPLRRANTLAPAEGHAVHDAIVEVIGASIERRGTTFSDFRDLAGAPGRNRDYLQVFHRDDAPCPRCETPIQMMRVGGRGTSFCPTCQRLELDEHYNRGLTPTPALPHQGGRG